MFDLIFRSLTQRKMRTGLTIFGIALGIFAIVVMGGMSEYFNLNVEKSLNLVSDKINVDPSNGILESSKLREVRRVPGVSDAFGVLFMSLDPENSGMFGGNFVFGIEPEKQERMIKDTKLTSGRLLVPGDSYKAVIGSRVAGQLKLKVGDEIVLSNRKVQRSSTITSTRNCTVVGILEYTGSDLDKMVMMPLDKVQKFYDREGTLTRIYAIPDKENDPEDLAKRIELSVEDVKTTGPEQVKKEQMQTLMIFSLITVSAAVLAAIIGGLSVMNTMLMSVSERTKEFGLLKALGVERKSILSMTMGEAALMGIIGGITGNIAGAIVVYSLNGYLESIGYALFAVTPRLVMVAMLFAITLGIVCGTYPAYRATKLSPLEALRYE